MRSKYHTIYSQFETLWNISHRENGLGRERILVILVFAYSVLSILFSLWFLSLTLLFQSSWHGQLFLISLLCFSIGSSAIWLIKKGFWKIVRSIILLALAIPTLYLLTRWGTLSPIPLLGLGLLIILVSLLISIRVALIMVILVGSYLGLIMYLHQQAILAVDLSWMQLLPNHMYLFEIMGILLIFVFIIKLVLSDIDTSLRRARQTEEKAKVLEEAQLYHLNQIEHLVTIGRASAGLFHDLVNPLTALSLHIQELKNISFSQSAEITERIKQAVRITNRLIRLAKQIKDELRQQSKPQRINIRKALEQAIMAVQYEANQKGINLNFIKENKIYAYCDPVRFERAIVNLLTNGIEAFHQTHKNAQITVTLSSDTAYNYINIKDNGPGIAPEQIETIFEPFVTSKRSNHGLGLATTKNILNQELNATITASNLPNSGACFTISWRK